MWFVYLVPLSIAIVLQSAVEPVQGRQHCRRLFMQGLDNTELLPFPQLSGVYRLVEADQNSSFPMYRHERLSDEVFSYDSSTGTLHIGRRRLLTARAHRGIFPRPSQTYPYDDVIRRWTVYDLVARRYRSVAANVIRPRCVDDDFQRCDSGLVELLGQPRPAGVGYPRYRQMFGLYVNLRPVYRLDSATQGRNDASRYLYHLDGCWRLGQSYLSSSSSRYSTTRDAALRPEYITGTWITQELGRDTENLQHLRFRCAGIVGANTCASVRCQNGGKCVESAGSRVICLCQRGYRGSHCQTRVPACRQSGSFANDFGNVRYSLDNIDGSLTTTFCRRRQSPKFAVSVCNHGRWSNLAECPIVTKNAAFGARRRVKRDTSTPSFLKNVDPWLSIVLMLMAILATVATPLIIYTVLVCCGGYNRKMTPFAGADQRDDEALAQRYRQMLNELDAQPMRQAPGVGVAELNVLHQQLEDDINDVRLRRRRRNRESKKKIKLLRTMSMYYYGSWWIWFLFVVVVAGAGLGALGSTPSLLQLVGIIFFIALPVFICVESRRSTELKYLKSISSVRSAADSIETLRQLQPSVSMRAECYHYRTVMVNNIPTPIKEISRTIDQPFRFQRWYDASDATLSGVRKTGITTVRIELAVHFADDKTAARFADEYRRFQEANRGHDEHVEFSTDKTVAGYEKKIAAFSETEEKPVWIATPWYWVATFLCFSWPYRMLFRRQCHKTDFKLVKVIYADDVDDSSAAVDGGEGKGGVAVARIEPETDDGPIYDNVVSYTRDAIQTTLEGLAAGRRLSTANDDRTVPMRCAVKPKPLNVVIRQSHFAQ